MGKTTKTMKSSNLYRKIDVSRLAGSERLEVIGALKAARRLNDALNSAIEMFEGVARWMAASPKLKHQ